MKNITKCVKQDHRDLEGYGNTILKSGDSDERTRFQNELTWELARHYAAEELIICPALEIHLGEGSKVADSIRQQHQGVRT